MSAEGKELRHAVIQELRERQNEVYTPSPNIDIVWVVSAPGTVFKAPKEGIYKGKLIDLERVEAGINIVKTVTALRLGIKSVDQITVEDIERHGPILFYNGENKDNGKYAQNEDFGTLSQSPHFPLPESKVVIQRLEEIYTPGQVKGLAKFLEDSPDKIKVAVVTNAPHLRRVGRYLKKYENLFQNIEFEEACIPEEETAVGAILGEMKRIKTYYAKGDLAETSIF